MTWIIENLPPFHERERERTSARFRSFNAPWNLSGYNTQERVGSLMASAKAYAEAVGYESVTRQGWAQYYLDEVRSEDHVKSQVEEIAQRENLSLQQALGWWWMLVIDATFRGFHSEIQCLLTITPWAEEKGLTLRLATDFEDRAYGVDIIVLDRSGKATAGIQVKPSTYFTSHSSGVKKAREEWNPRKYEKWTRDTGTRVWYLEIDRTLRLSAPHWIKASY